MLGRLFSSSPFVFPLLTGFNATEHYLCVFGLCASLRDERPNDVPFNSSRKREGKEKEIEEMKERNKKKENRTEGF